MNHRNTAHVPLGALRALLRDEPGLTRALAEPDSVLGIPEVARPISIAAIAHLSARRPLLVACPTGTMAAQLVDDLEQFLGDDVALFPAWETLPFERVSPTVETMGRRCEVLWRIRDPDRSPAVIVGGARALLQRLVPDADRFEPIVVERGASIDLDALAERLVGFGYRPEPLAEHRGEFARRGAIVDVYPSTGDHPLRIDLWGDEVDRLTAFSVADQRSTHDLERVEIFPARELRIDDDLRARATELVATEPWAREHWERIAEGIAFDGMESWLPWLVHDDRLVTELIGSDAKVVLIEPRRLRDRAGELLAEEDDLARTLASTWARDPSRAFPRLHVEPDRLLARNSAAGDHGVWSIDSTTASTTGRSGAASSDDQPVTVTTSGWPPILGSGAEIIDRIRNLLSEGYRVVVCADGEGSSGRIAQLLADAGLDLSRTDRPDDLVRPGGWITTAPISRGCILPAARLAIVAESDLTGRRRAHRAARARQRISADSFDDLQPGNYVVHHQHGVGRYEAMVTRSIGGVERDYLLIAYRGDDRLYIPSDQLASLRRYSGGEAPSLNRLGGADFAATRNRVRSAIREIAQELVLLYQQRVNADGFAFGRDTPWQAEMESSFGYVETPDQQRAIDDVKADMERSTPMDRLLCGDVGFGKTEVAIRAAFKAIQDGKQVAVLAPTTLLANQHGTTFADRFTGYPIRTEVLSRFLTPAQARKVVEELASGEVDCVIGTHRLLGDDVRFRDLGLLIVDEEQRFGVHHKEAMKRLKTAVDVLTLSATPIPRTLEMSLVGIRDLSLLQTPPADRQPILTYVGEYDERVAVEAIRRELLREGQVFWVHNRVRSIEHAAARLRELVPEARIAVAHGQLDEGSLEQVVLDFWEGRHDVLVCTTIIESGIDMPAVNTLVVERADLLGLGQLHQLRGRVGRSGSRAYAYLFHPTDRPMSEEAYERLRTIGESTELGSGFRIAMRDLEIRGAGNLLGPAQSGHIAAVGYDLYCQMVTEVVAEMKGEALPAPVEIRIDVPTDAHLPSDYIDSTDLRLEAYRRLSNVSTAAEIEDLRTEWLDRYGPLPAPAESLLKIAVLRTECLRLGIGEVHVTGTDRVRISPLHLKVSETLRLARLARESKYKQDQAQLILPLPAAVRRGTTEPAEYLVGFLRELITAET
jgi:transcription-repair coupling factor (superfamily II helicase)